MIAVLVLAGAAIAGPLEDALHDAVKRGDFAELRNVNSLIRLSAEQGKPEAQYLLGVMYATAPGKSPDYVLASMWLTLAAGQGEKNAGIYRDITARKMTTDQLTVSTPEQKCIGGPEQ